MHRLCIGCAVAVLVLTTCTARAEDYKCACKNDKISAVQAITSPKLKCNSSETYTTYDSHVSVQEHYLKLKIAAKHLIEGADDRHIDFQLRPRNGWCLQGVKDTGSDKPVGSTDALMGLCEAGKWLTFQDLSLHQKDSTDTVDWTARFNAFPSIASKSRNDYDGLIYYIQGSDGKRYAAAVCLQDK